MLLYYPQGCGYKQGMFPNNLLIMRLWQLCSV